MSDVFISYKRRLRPQVERIATALRELRVDVWFDAALEPGVSFSAEISHEVRNAGCVLDVVDGEKLVWTSALAPQYRPAEMATEGCESFPMTAIVTMADAGNGKTLYRAFALHRNKTDRDMHANMGFEEGWGKCAEQLEDLAKELAVRA